MSNRVITFHGATLGVSEYDIPAIDVVIHDGAPLFLTATGVAKFDAEADAPVASIETGALVLSPGASCNVPSLRVQMQSDHTATVTVRNTGAGPSCTASYRMPPRRVTSTEQQRTVFFGRGPRGVEWTLRINSGGGPWSLSAMDVKAERARPQR